LKKKGLFEDSEDSEDESKDVVQDIKKENSEVVGQSNIFKKSNTVGSTIKQQSEHRISQ